VANTLWEELYAAAMVELDLAKLPGRIEKAQIAIRRALQELRGNPGSDGGAGVWEQTQALIDALRNLRTLQNVEFKTSAAGAGPWGCGSDDPEEVMP